MEHCSSRSCRVGIVDTRRAWIRGALAWCDEEDLVSIACALHHGAMACDVTILFTLARGTPTPSPRCVRRTIRCPWWLARQERTSRTPSGDERSALDGLAHLLATSTGAHHAVCPRVRVIWQDARICVTGLPTLALGNKFACRVVHRGRPANRILTEHPTRCFASKAWLNLPTRICRARFATCARRNFGWGNIARRDLLHLCLQYDTVN